MNYFKLNESHVVFENYDDEAVLINLANGNYYRHERRGCCHLGIRGERSIH